MKVNSIFIDLRNAEQVSWWMRDASLKVKVKGSTDVVETATGKIIGVVMRLGGIHAKKVLKENLKFLGNNVHRMVIDTKG